MSKKIYNIGVYDLEDNTAIKSSKILKKAYDSWVHILRKCKKKNEKISEEWVYFSNYYRWYIENFPRVISNIDFVVTKDLLDDNGEYSKETCLIIPLKILRFIRNNKKNNSSGFKGVHWHTNRNLWEVQIRDFETHKNVYGGGFDNFERAKECYNELRKEQIEKAKEYLRLLDYDENIVLLLDNLI